jgi:mono/diheme cytochrome c family protein
MGRCSRCHNGQSGLPNWLDYKIAYADRHEIKRRVWDSWKGAYYKQSMPAGNSQECELITEQERKTLKGWVVEGGVYGMPETETQPRSKQERMERGQKVFAMVCAACHQSNGQGIPDKFPPLAGSDFLNADKNRAIKTLINGRQGEIMVNGRKFNNSMPLLPLGDDDIASALTFVYNSFGNSGKTVTPEEIKALRGQPDLDAPGQKEIAHSVEQKSDFE